MAFLIGKAATMGTSFLKLGVGEQIERAVVERNIIEHF
jgi:hypothetical protein